MKKSKLQLSKQTVCQLEKGIMGKAYGGTDDQDSGHWLCGKETDPLYFDCDELATNDCDDPRTTDCHIWSEDHPCGDTYELPCGSDNSWIECNDEELL